MFKILDVAGSGLAAQQLRLNTVASNLANADTVSGDPAAVYRARHVKFQAVEGGVQVAGVLESAAEPLKRHEPGNPLADENGFVYAPRVDSVGEMVNMISASRSYQNNLEVMNTSKELLLRTLMMGQ